MKKGVAGLIGIVMAISGCQSYSPYHQQVSKLRSHFNEINRILGLNSGETPHFYDSVKEGGPVKVFVESKDNIKVIIYQDADKDGIYESRNTFEIPKKMDLKILPPLQKNNEREYSPKKKEVSKKYI